MTTLSFHVGFLRSLLLVCIVSVCVFAEVDPIVIKGSHFFYKTNGSEFLFRGVGYQDQRNNDDQSFIDPLANVAKWCQRDIPKLQGISVNVIRVDNLDAGLDHAGCMEALADAGIYVLVRLLPYYLIKNQIYYDTASYNYSMAIIDNMAKYTNTLGFYTPQKWTRDSDLPSAPMTKALIRDAKQYMSSKSLREIPVGTISDTFSTITPEHYIDDTLDFLSCDSVHSDFFGVRLDNLTCPPGSWIEAQAERFADASMPVILLSQGCNKEANANDTTNYPLETVYSNRPPSALSGSVFYEYFNSSQGPGLCTPKQGAEDEVVEEDVYKGLSSAMKSLSISTLNAAQYTPPASKTTACPTPRVAWTVPGATLPPSPNQSVCSCMMQTLDCVGSPVVMAQLAQPDKLTTYYRLACGDDFQGCPGTILNATLGEYGAFSACAQVERFSWDIDYWSKHNSFSQGDCKIKGYIDPANGNLSDYDGAMKKQTPSVNLNAECKFLLEQAGVNGTGTITNYDFARATSSTNPTNTGNPSNQNSNQKSSLSIGAKAGIGLGAAAAVILTLLLVLFILHRKKQARKAQTFENPELPADNTGASMAEKYRYQELGLENVAEMEHPPAEAPTGLNPEQPVELHGDAAVAELEQRERFSSVGTPR
ncbi:carbohydrate-binding module family 43 protein [Zopfia rhizophila CBS 207.26]|uniref:1,3-beta-glucanosyltransferase n=1 Tax=Zopfia rhizophila CBS 207.26 TaxID=1314779 RepID=A0A6A6EVQ9_9PEZI|nr:carbohydrate-binding module family 43 protein [Zopfia rhizophila CBS 207.26]